MFTHPKCNCTRASLAMLQQIVGAAAPKPKVVLVAWCPDHPEPGWTQNSAPGIGRSLSDAEIYFDQAGAEARRDFMPATRSDLANGLEPSTAQPANNSFIGAERCNRQGTDRLRFSAIADDAAMDMVAQRPRAGRGAGDRRADRKTLRSQHMA